MDMEVIETQVLILTQGNHDVDPSNNGGLSSLNTLSREVCSGLAFEVYPEPGTILAV